MCDIGNMRKNWIDNLRWVTVVLVLLYHVIYFYNNKGVFGGIGGFEDDPKGQPQDIVMYILYPWFMMLLFLVAGISARYSLQKRSAREFRKSRTLKLLVPSTIGLLVFQWIVGYFNTRIVNPFGDLPLLIRWPLYALSGVGPLWFAQELWVFSLLLLLVRKLDGRDRFWAWCGKASIPVIILLGLLVYLGSQVLIMNPRLGTFDGLFNLYKPLTYFIPFLMGYFVFSHDEVQERVAKMRVPALICAVAAGTALCITCWGKDNTDPKILSGWLNCLFVWTMILAMMGWFKACFDRTDRFCSYMNRSNFGLYVMHYSVIATIGFMLKIYTTLPPAVIYTLLTVAVFTLTPLLYELFKRIPFIRWAVLGEKGK